MCCGQNIPASCSDLHDKVHSHVVGTRKELGCNLCYPEGFCSLPLCVQPMVCSQLLCLVTSDCVQ